MSGAAYLYLLRSSGLGIGATQGFASASITAVNASGTTVSDSFASTLLVDTSSPSVSLSSATNTGTTLSGGVQIQADFLEPVTGVTASSFVAVGGIISSLSASGNTYTFTATPTANTQSGTLTIRMNGGSVTDVPGNPNTASNTLEWSYDTQKPSINLTKITTASIANGGTGSFQLTANEPITGLTNSSFTVSGGAISSVTGSGTTYTVVFTPTTNVNSGTFTVSLTANKVRDALLNFNTASNSLSWSYDTLIPTLTLSGTGQINQTNQSSYTLSGSCSENGRSISITLDSVSTTATCTSGAFSKTFSVAGAVDGTLPLSLVLTDAVGNSITRSTTVIKDTVVPTLSLSPLSYANTANVGVYKITGSCSENGRPVSLSITDSFTTVTASPSCTSGAFTGTVDFSGLAEGLFTVSANLQDTAGNGASTAIRYSTKDTLAPAMTLIAPSAISLANVTATSWNGSCSENGRAVQYFLGSLSGSTLCALGGYAWTIDTTLLPEGNVTLTGSTSDVAGNTISSSKTVLKDTLPPVLTLTGSIGTSVTLTGAVFIQLTSNEPITGIADTGLIVTGGTLTGFTAS
jgi:hypothetical protein